MAEHSEHVPIYKRKSLGFPKKPRRSHLRFPGAGRRCKKAVPVSSSNNLVAASDLKK